MLLPLAHCAIHYASRVCKGREKDGKRERRKERPAEKELFTRDEVRGNRGKFAQERAVARRHCGDPGQGKKKVKTS